MEKRVLKRVIKPEHKRPTDVEVANVKIKDRHGSPLMVVMREYAESDLAGRPYLRRAWNDAGPSRKTQLMAAHGHASPEAIAQQEKGGEDDDRILDIYQAMQREDFSRTLTVAERDRARLLWSAQLQSKVAQAPAGGVRILVDLEDDE